MYNNNNNNTHFKNGNQKVSNNYKGINLVNTCYKIFAKILNDKLNSNWNPNADSLAEDNARAAFTLKFILEKEAEFTTEAFFIIILGLRESTRSSEETYTSQFTT